MKPDINRLLDLQKLLHEFSLIERKVDRKHKDAFIPENDTEHSYNLAMTAWFLAAWFPELDKDRVIKYALAHDIVEVHAGDTYVYAPAKELASKVKREAEALKKLEKEWPDFPELTDMLHGYANKRDPEARFVYALDKLMPVMLVFINEGHSWSVQEVTVSMLESVKSDKVKFSPDIIPYYEQLIKLLLEHPELIKKS